MKIASKIVLITSLACTTLAFAQCPPVNGFALSGGHLMMGDTCTYVSSQPMGGAGLMGNTKECNMKFKTMLTDPHYTFKGNCSINNQNRCVCIAKRNH